MLSRRHLLSGAALAASGLVTLGALADGLRGALPERAPAPAPDAGTHPRCVVLGFDGVDAGILQGYLAAGELPHLRALADAGGFAPLRSELPPESPVAWASLLTGVNPGRHRIHDFVVPDDRLTPVNGMVDLQPLRLLLGRVPVRAPRVTSRLAAPTFLERVHAAGYPVLSLKQPHAFPAPALPGARVLSGLGTPDLAGSAGAYTLWSSALGYASMVTEFGGTQRPLTAGPVEGRYETWIEGPLDPSLPPGYAGGVARATAPLVLEVQGAGAAAEVWAALGGRRVRLPRDAPSEFVRVPFTLGTLPPLTVHGLVRFELRSVAPLTVMADPVQIDPQDAAVPLSTPPGYAAELLERYGPFETMGWQEQTFALNDLKQDDAAFLRDALDDMRRGLALLLGELRHGSRCVFQCFTATDRVTHCFYRLRDKGHHAYDPALERRLGDPILTAYREMDRIVGEVRARLAPEDLLLVCSDHGFQTWRYGVNLNRWLADQGYLVLRGAAGGPKDLRQFFTRGSLGLESIDWARTRAVAVGLGQIFLNVRGRRAEGIVPPQDVRALREEIARGLLALRNDFVPDEAPISRVFFLHEEYHGPYAQEAGDLQVGFAPGYRVSWQTALVGGTSAGVLERNDRPWSGDHCSTDPDHVLGVVLANRPIAPAPEERAHHVRDIAATALRHFGLPVDDLDGRPLPLGSAR